MKKTLIPLFVVVIITVLASLSLNVKFKPYFTELKTDFLSRLKPSDSGVQSAVSKPTDASKLPITSEQPVISNPSVSSEVPVISEPPVVSEPPANKKKLIEVPNIKQYPKLPTGCESVAATMLLKYYGVNITAEEFVNSWLECDGNFYTENGILYGPDPNEVFVGSPFNSGSFGCFAGPIVNAINNNCKTHKAEKITDKTLLELCENYIDNDNPLLIWATGYMQASYQGKTWCFADGTKFIWPAREHCLVLVGYDEKNYFLNDPMTGTTVTYQKSLVEKRFKELGGQAVCIISNENKSF